MLEPEWISWSPDSPGYPNCPVAPGTDCEVRFAEYGTSRDKRPQDWKWDHIGSPSYDIIAYRVWPAAEDARALLVAIRNDVELAHDCLIKRGWHEMALEVKERLARIDAYLEKNP